MPESKRQAACPWCHATETGDYSMYKFVHPSDPERYAILSFYGAKISVETTQPGGDAPDRISCKITYCPMCGRKFGKGEKGE